MIGGPAGISQALADAEVDADDDDHEDEGHSLGLSQRRLSHRSSLQATHLDADPELVPASSASAGGLRASLLQREECARREENLSRPARLCKAVWRSLRVIGRVVFCCSGRHVTVIRSWPRTIKVVRWISSLTKLDWTARALLPVLFFPT